MSDARSPARQRHRARPVAIRRAMAEALARRGVPRAIALVEAAQRRTWRVQLVAASTSRDEVRTSVAEAHALVTALCVESHLLDVGDEILVVPEVDGQRLAPVVHLRLDGPPPRWLDVRGGR